MLFLETLKLILAIAFALFLPGYFLLRLFKNKIALSPIENLVASFGISFFIINFLFIFLNKIGFQINFPVVFISIFIFVIVLCLLGKNFNQKERTEKIPKVIPKIEKENYSSILGIKFQKKALLFLLIFLFAIIIRLFFLSERLLPQSTDLGHHSYWSKYIVDFGHLPNYGMPDFIIGEHIVFALISILSGVGFISSMPMAILFLFNVFSLLACFVCAYQLSRCFLNKNESQKIALLTLLAIGVFQAVSSPGAKFVSGGVIGNIIGNFLIPLAFFFLAKFIRKRENFYSASFVLTLAMLAYTHHLSSFIFLYIFIGFLFFTIIFSFFDIIINKNFQILSEAKIFIKNILNRWTISSLLFFLLFVFFVRTPSYLNQSAIETAVGEPSKDTRTGLSFETIVQTAGDWRFFYGTIGFIALLILFFIFQKKRTKIKNIFNFYLSSAILLAWGGMIFAMSYFPKALRVDIPSNRIGSYIAYPSAFLSAIGVFFIIYYFSKSKLRPQILTLLVLIIFASGFIWGLEEIYPNKRGEVDRREIYQTYRASEYLAERALPDQQLLKDHIYLAGDTWIKLFFMLEYRYPLSRSYLKRYNDPVKPRETCTRDMVAIPDSEIGKKCFEEYAVKYVMLKKGFDTAQFEKSPNFSKIFSSDQAVIYQKNE